MHGNSVEDDIEFWLGDDADYDPDPMLLHLTDRDILGLGDSYDDGRIDVLARSYLELRRKLAAGELTQLTQEMEL